MKITKNLLVFAICSMPYLMIAGNSSTREQGQEEQIIEILLEDISFFGFEDTTPKVGDLIVFNQEGDVILKVRNTLDALEQLNPSDRQLIMDSDLLMETAEDRLMIID